MGNSPVLAGSWQENSGRKWHCTQNGNHFTWTQEGTGRVATGTAVPTSGGQWAIHITFDGSVHWKLTASQDGNKLYGPSDTFTKVVFGVATQAATSNIIIPSMLGNYQENSGKVWTCNYHSGGHFTLHNQQDGRNADGYCVKDYSGKYTIYLCFHNQGGDHLLKVETMDVNTLPLSNGDCFRKQGVSMPMVNQPPVGVTINTPFGGLSIGSTPQMNIHTSHHHHGHIHTPPPMVQPQIQMGYTQPMVQPQMGMSSGLLSQILTACSQTSFENDKLKAVKLYVESQYAPLSANDITQILGQFSFDNNKEKVIEVLRKTNNIQQMDCMSCTNILRYFSMDNDKVKAVNHLCPFIWDRKQNCELVCSCLSFSNDKNRVRDTLLKH
ncbi:hypothetical protein ABK040_005968 [Willaertia magna]